MAVRAWQVHDTGLVAVLPRFRRLPGRVRHHQRGGSAWPTEVVLDLVDEELVVAEVGGAVVGRWPRAELAAVRLADGPPVSFTLDLGGSGTHLLAAPAGPAVDALLRALGPEAGP